MSLRAPLNITFKVLKRSAYIRKIVERHIDGQPPKAPERRLILTKSFNVFFEAIFRLSNPNSPSKWGIGTFDRDLKDGTNTENLVAFVIILRRPNVTKIIRSDNPVFSFRLGDVKVVCWKLKRERRRSLVKFTTLVALVLKLPFAEQSFEQWIPFSRFEPI